MRLLWCLAAAAACCLSPSSVLAQNQCSSFSFSQSVSVNGNQLIATFTPSAGQSTPTFVDLHISKNCPGNPGPSTSKCPAPWIQDPFDAAHAINLHASGTGAYSSGGASFDGSKFSFSVDISALSLASSDQLCYDFTYAFGSLGCDTGICIPSLPTTKPPTTAPFEVPTTPPATTLPSTCSALTYTQDVAIQGNSIIAHFKPDAGKPIPTWVDIHVSRNCPGNPQPSSTSCSAPWVQDPFDFPYAINLHASSSPSQFSSPGASYANGVFTFNFDATALIASLGPNNVFCYDFTYAFGSLGCDTGICSLSSPTTAPFVVPTTLPPTTLPSTCSALTYTQDVALQNNRVIAHFKPDAGKPIPTWVDIHVSRNCPGNPQPSSTSCSAPWVQPPFDAPYAINLHASSSPSQFSSPGASYANGVFTFNFDATALIASLGPNNVFCYDFTYAFGSLGCDTGICSLSSGTSSPTTSPPSTSPLQSCCTSNQCATITPCGAGLQCCETRPVWMESIGGYCYDPTKETCANCPVFNPNHPQQQVCSGTNQICCEGCQDGGEFQCCHSFGSFVAWSCPVNYTCCGLPATPGNGVDPIAQNCCAPGQTCRADGTCGTS